MYTFFFLTILSLLSPFHHLFSQVYGRDPPELEVEHFLKAFESKGKKLPYVNGLQPSAHFVDVEIFTQVIKSVRQAINEIDTRTATEFKSSEELVRCKQMGKGSEYGPREKYRIPLTTSQEYGWHVQMPHERPEIKPKRTCAETQFASAMVQSGLI